LSYWPAYNFVCNCVLIYCRYSNTIIIFYPDAADVIYCKCASVELCNVIVCYKLVLAFFYLPVVISSVATDGKLGGRQGEDARMSVAFPGKTGTILDF